MKKLFLECLHKDLNNKIGIYKIICKTHTYIGSSINIYYRLKRHISDLRRKKHANRYMQNTYNKYNELDFLFEIVELCNKEILIDRESYYIKLYNSDLNLDLNPTKRVFKEESLIRISETLKEGYKSGRIINPSSKIVYRYNVSGEYIDSFPSGVEAAKYLNIASKTVSGAASGRKNSAGGYLWSYTKENTIIRVMAQQKRVRSINTKGDVVNTWISIKDLAKSLNRSQSAISIRIKTGNYNKDLKYEFF